MRFPLVPRREFLQSICVALLLTFALAHLIVRGPIDHKGYIDLCDFASHFASARLWLVGANPYDNTLLWETWISGRGAFNTDHDFWLALLPPSSFAVLAPLAALPPGVAALLWTIIGIACSIAILASVMRLAGLRLGTLPAWIFIAAAIASAPMQTLLAVGQVSLPAIALIFLAFRFASDRRSELLAGALLGTAAALKPQLAAPFFLWFLFFRRWRTLNTAVITLALFALIGIFNMQLRGIDWLAAWSSNIAASVAPGGPNDPTASGPWRNQMIDLRVWLFTLLDEHGMVVLKSILVSTLLALAYVAMLLRQRHQRDRLLPLATLCALTLLPVYHKAYDAALLIPALAWALVALRDSALRRIAIVTLVSLSPFLIPFDFLPLIMQRTDRLDALAQTWLWRVVIFPHHALSTLTTSLCLLYAMWLSLRRAEPIPELPIEMEVDEAVQTGAAVAATADFTEPLEVA